MLFRNYDKAFRDLNAKLDEALKRLERIGSNMATGADLGAVNQALGDLKQAVSDAAARVIAAIDQAKNSGQDLQPVVDQIRSDITDLQQIAQTSPGPAPGPTPTPTPTPPTARR